jgi:hypothetical protein
MRSPNGRGKRFKLPSHDQLVECHLLWKSLGVLDLAACKGLLAAPMLMPLLQLQALRRRLLAINWRLTNFYVRPSAIDFIALTETSFANYDRTAWFSPQEVAELPPRRRRSCNSWHAAGQGFGGGLLDRPKHRSRTSFGRQLALRWTRSIFGHGREYIVTV